MKRVVRGNRQLATKCICLGLVSRVGSGTVESWGGMERVLADEEEGGPRNMCMTGTEEGRSDYYQASHAPAEVVVWCNMARNDYGQERECGA